MKKDLDLSKLGNISLTETEKEKVEIKAERPYKTLVAMSKDTKVKLAKLKIATEKNVIEILSDIVEREIEKLAKENEL